MNKISLQKELVKLYRTNNLEFFLNKKWFLAFISRFKRAFSIRMWCIFLGIDEFIRFCRWSRYALDWWNVSLSSFRSTSVGGTNPFPPITDDEILHNMYSVSARPGSAHVARLSVDSYSFKVNMSVDSCDVVIIFGHKKIQNPW